MIFDTYDSLLVLHFSILLTKVSCELHVHVHACVYIMYMYILGLGLQITVCTLILSSNVVVNVPILYEYAADLKFFYVVVTIAI